MVGDERAHTRAEANAPARLRPPQRPRAGRRDGALRRRAAAGALVSGAVPPRGGDLIRVREGDVGEETDRMQTHAHAYGGVDDERERRVPVVNERRGEGRRCD